MSTHHGQAVPHAALWDALLVFQASPGRYAVAQREPRLLFEHTQPVLTLAANRPVDVPGNPPAAVRQAARFFVRHAMLRDSSDHYTLMGLQPDADAATLREHYRLLIRLTHPDFDQNTDPWPEGTAARVNRAHDVLASAVKRAEYDTQRKRAQVPPETQAQRTRASLARGDTAHHAQSKPSRTAVYASAGLAVAAVGALMLMGHTADDPSLVLATGERRAAQPPLPAPISPSAQANGGRWERLVEAPESAPFPEPTSGQATARAGAQAQPDALPGLFTLPAAKTRADLNIDAPMPIAQVRPFGNSPDAQTLPPPSSVVLQAAQHLGAWPVEKLAAATTAANNLPSEAAEAGVDPRAGTNEAPTPAAMGNAMQRLQPMLVDLLQMLETGQSEQLRQWAARSTRDEASAAQFASAYRMALNGGLVTGLGATQFDLHEALDRQVVLGSVQIRLQDDRQQIHSTNFRLRAHFVTREGAPQWTQLVAE